jgi:DNA repair protein RecO (recombination protein O)
MKPSRVYVAEGIVLKRRNVGEADRILTVFTKKYGKIRVIAKGVRRITSRRAGHIEVFTRVILTLHSYKNMDIVTEAQAITAEPYLKPISHVWDMPVCVTC